jgi:leucyl-tRNA synthetase
MILGEGGVKMSKSLGNVINPDDVIQSYGADAMRLYEMFMGPLEVSKPWSTKGIAGIKRFLDRVWRLSGQSLSDDEPPKELLKVLHQTIRKVSADTRTLQFNTAIAQMMIFLNEAGKHEVLYRGVWQPFVLILAPYAPHLAEELWEKLGHEPSIAYQPYAQWDEELAKEDTVTVVFQINGKIRAREDLPVGLPKDQLERTALEHPRIQELLEGKKPDKVIVVVDRLVNLVVRSA